MKVRSRIACLSAAVFAALYGGSSAQAADLVWDANGADAPVGQDGGGQWNLSNLNWVSNYVAGTPATGTNVAFQNGDNATLGNETSVALPDTFNGVTVASGVTVNNLNIGVGSNGGAYNLYGQLTLAGNLTKFSTTGAMQTVMNGGLSLTAGDHVFAIRDTPGDLAELAILNPINGAGGITLNNGTAYGAYGTLVFDDDNTYAGTTNIVNGRLIINRGSGLGSTAGGTTISNAGTLAIGGAGLAAFNDIVSNEAITITRSAYGVVNGNADFDRYRAAIIATNDGNVNTHTFTGPMTIDSTDARVEVNTNRLIISGNLIAGGTNVAPANAVFTAAGDFAGFLRLSGNNTAFGTAGGTIRITGGVELEADSEANLGGATSKLQLAGGTIRPTGALGASGSAFMTNFGAHDLSGSPIGTGLDLDATQVFTVNNLSGNSIGTRGNGTINFNGTNTFTGAPFFDGGIANINGATTVAGVRLRNATLNLNNGSTFTTASSYTSIGVDNTENGTVNMNGNAVWSAANADFNVSDNAGSRGTLNIRDTASLTAAGIMFVGKNNDTVGTVNQSGGSLTLTRNGNFTFVLGDGRGNENPVGTYNLSGGTFTSAGEVYVGEGGGAAKSGTGNWIQTGGTANVNNWFTVGREGGNGLVDISGGTLVKAGNGFMSLGDSSNSINATNVINVRGTGAINATTGEFWVGQNGGTKTVMTVSDSGSVTVNNWFAVGRQGSNGTLNFTGGTITKQGANALVIASVGGVGTFNQSGGTLTSNATWLGENNLGTLDISAGTASLGDTIVGLNGDNGNGVVNVRGTANVTANGVILANQNKAAGTINLSGGTLAANGFTANNGGGTGVGTINFNGGTLVARTDNATFIGPKVITNVSTGGAKINTGNHAVTINSGLNHDAALAGADGGLAVSGGGSLTLAGVNTYNGPTSVTDSTLTIASTGSVSTTSLNSNTAITNNGTLAASGGGSIDSINGTGTLTVSGGTLALSNPTVGALNTQAAVNLTGTGVLNIRKSQLRVNGDQYATLASSYTGGRLISSDAAASPTNRVVGIRFDGTNTTARYTTYGDVNLDGRFNGTDVALINGANAFGLPAGSANYSTGDTNYDNRFNGTDVARINGSNSFGLGTVTVTGDQQQGLSVARALTTANAIAQTTNNSTIDLQYDPTTGNLKVITNGIGYGTVTMSATSSVFTDGVFGTSPEFYSDDNGDGTSFFFGVLVGQQTADVVLPGVLDKNQTLATLLSAITVTGITNGPDASRITFSTLGAVPEPTTLGALALVAGAFGRRRRRA